MQHLTLADKSLLVGDAFADLLGRYAALLAGAASADLVKFQAIGPVGEEVTTGLLLNAGTVLVMESTVSALPEPDNTEVEARLQRQIASFDVNSQIPFDPSGDEYSPGGA